LTCQWRNSRNCHHSPRVLFVSECLG